MMLHRPAAILLLASLGSAVTLQLKAQVPDYPSTDQFQQFTPQTNQYPTGRELVPQVPPDGTFPFNELPDVPPSIDPDESFAALDESESWILPAYWFNPVGWEGGIEIGISGTEGNAEAFSIRTGGKLKRKTDLQEITANITYLKASADGIESQHNALFNSGLERFFGDSRWSFFFKDSLEYDEFKAFDLRFAANAGIGFKLIDSDTTKLKGRYGAGTSYEIGGPNDKWIPELVYGVDFERQLTERQKLALTVDYFPEWGNFRNYRVVSDFSWEVLLDEEHNLNLKLSVNDRYDSTPNGLKPNDVNYALLLLWNL